MHKWKYEAAICPLKDICTPEPTFWSYSGKRYCSIVRIL